jgi:oligoendopeptidase F
VTTPPPPTPSLSRRETLLVAAAMAGALHFIRPTIAQAARDQTMTTATMWDLTELYPNDAAWTAERDAVAKKLPSLRDFKGRLGTSAATLKEALTAASDVSRRIARLYVYASLKADEDLRIAPNQERRHLATDLYTAFGEATAWTDPEILTIGQAKIDQFLAAEPGLGRFRFRLEDTLRRAPHTLGAEAEGVIAGSASALAGPNDIRDQLVESDIPWPEVTLSDGRKARLDNQGYTLHRDAPARADRKLVFDRFWAEYRIYESSLGAALISQIKGETFLARARKYPSALAASLDGPRLPEAVYRTLVAETNRGLPSLHRYFELRRRILKLPDMRYYDIYPPLVSLARKFSLDDMRRLTLEAIKPLGPDYGALFAKATAAKWMDPLPRPGKASGAYMNGGAYDVHPFLMLNLSEQYDGLTTYAHEWGHAMHTLLANAAQPYETADYPTFIAEIASTCQEVLLARHMLAQAQSREEKLFYLGQIMENIRGTFFRQTMFAEFQLLIHDLEEKGEGLSGERFTKLYGELLARYHGPKVIIDPAYAVEWAYIPHFFMGFYVFQYATSITAAMHFAEAVTKGEAERERYLSVLKAGGSDYGYDILKRAGLDMAKPEPYRELVKTFDQVLDQAEALLPAGT